jgi:drug/metabolite transporter (DMT)-like permease
LLVFLLVFAVGKERLPWRALPPVAALGVLGISVGQVAQAFGVEGTSASVGTIISATIPVFVVVFAALRLKQPVTGRQQLGLLAAFAGIALVAMGNGQEATTTPQSHGAIKPAGGRRRLRVGRVRHCTGRMLSASGWARTLAKRVIGFPSNRAPGARTPI